MNAEQKISNLEDAEKLIKQLQSKIRTQSLQFLTWHRKFRIQEEMLIQITRDRNEQLKILSAKLILFEAKLSHKQAEISNVLSNRENIILKQQQTIKTLQKRLMENGDEWIKQSNLDSLNDSDSAVIMEDDDNCSSCFGLSSCRSMSGNSENITVARSVSDVLEPDSKMLPMRRNNGFLRRPEMLETVYSVEEDVDNDGNLIQNSHTENNESHLLNLNKEINLPPYSSEISTSRRNILRTYKLRKLESVDNIESLNYDEDVEEEEEDGDEGPDEKIIREPTNQVTTYNRVMSNNHRSVTKPKDVKYRRINKAKSKSLEELRGRLKNWVEKGNKFSFAFNHSS